MEKKQLTIKSIYIDYKDEKMVVSSPDVPITCWGDYEDALAHLDVTVQKADGTEQTIQGAAHLLALNKEQRNIVKKMEELSKKAVEMGIVFLGDWGDRVFAFNSLGIEGWNSDYNREAENGWESLDVQNEEFATGLSINIVSDENFVHIKRK